MNFSRSENYSDDRRETLRSRIVQATRTQSVPLSQYRFIHRNAHVTAAEELAIIQWARVEIISSGVDRGRPNTGKDFCKNTLAPR
jgi:hypothetical protein